MGIGCGEGEEGFTDLPIVRFTDWVFSIFDLGFMIGCMVWFLSWVGAENCSPALRAILYHELSDGQDDRIGGMAENIEDKLGWNRQNTR